MKVTISYFGQLRNVTKVKQETVETAETTGFLELLSQRAEYFGEPFRKIVMDESSRLRPSVLITVNGEMMDKQSPPPLTDGDNITLIPAIAGG